MTAFLDSFPRIIYDIDNKRLSKYDVITDITFRVAFIQEVLGNISSYYNYLIQDGDRPDILAERIYGNSTAHWIILLANNMIDGGYDWPMDSRSFNNYIKDKYGTIANAQTQIHHYEKVIQRYNSTTNTTTVTRLKVDEDTLVTANTLSVPYDSYTSLTAIQAVTTFEVVNDTVVETIYRDAISNYDYENQLNDEKRIIKIIKPEYYSLIIEQLDSLTGTDAISYRGII